MNRKQVKERYISPECETLDVCLEVSVAVSEPTFNAPFSGEEEEL